MVVIVPPKLSPGASGAEGPLYSWRDKIKNAHWVSSYYAVLVLQALAKVTFCRRSVRPLDVLLFPLGNISCASECIGEIMRPGMQQCGRVSVTDPVSSIGRGDIIVSPFSLFVSFFRYSRTLNLFSHSHFASIPDLIYSKLSNSSLFQVWPLIKFFFSKGRMLLRLITSTYGRKTTTVLQDYSFVFLGQ